MKLFAAIATLSLLATIASAQGIPADQKAFQDVIATTRAAYEAATNDLAKGGQRPKRAREICKILPSPRITDWVGTVDTLSTNGEGRGVFGVKLGNDIWLSTWNNALSDIGSDTLIDPESPLFQSLSQLSEGQKVTISGRFLKDEGDLDCFEEMSVTMNGSMSEPEFVFVFSDVQPAP